MKSESGSILFRKRSENCISERPPIHIVCEQGVEDGEEKSCCFARAGLSTAHNITASHDDGDGVLLDGSGRGVVGLGDVLHQHAIKVSSRKTS